MKILGRDVTVTVNTSSGRVTEGPGFRRVRVVIAVIALLAGTAFIAGTVYVMHHDHMDEFFFRRATAQGQVIENKYFVNRTATRNAPSAGYRAVISYHTGDGQEMKVNAFFSRPQPRYQIGLWMTVYYDPANPQHSIVDEGLPTYLVTIMPFVMGFLMLLGGVQGLLKRN